jgi:hypothetical protein
MDLRQPLHFPAPRSVEASESRNLCSSGRVTDRCDARAVQFSIRLVIPYLQNELAAKIDENELIHMKAQSTQSHKFAVHMQFF